MNRFLMTYRILPLFLLFFMSFSTLENEVKVSEKIIISDDIDTEIETIYKDLNNNHFDVPEIKSFTEALKGFYLLKEQGKVKKDILTIIDFSLSSTVKRLWVIDLNTKTILYNSLVAHGRNTGEEFADSFSNQNSSNKSSLGFYLTAEIYNGKHGKSLKLDGIERGINDNARLRGIVVHAADYVSESFIKNNHRLGRSQGCPALPEELSNEIINTIKDKTCLYIYHPSRQSKLDNLQS
ncbi:MAG TPA: murein L,D-transpeptidase catalytic domain family protein [Flavobacterium sp.]|nr:murein L,D-transpeptidase catalytic domain family protein [Flavobacterium sp.]